MEEIFLPPAKNWTIGSRQYSQNTLSAYDLLRLAGLLSKSLQEAMRENEMVAALAFSVDIENPDLTKLGTLIVGIIGYVSDIGLYFRHVLKKENGEELDDEDLKHLRRHLMPSQLSEVVQTLIQQNQAEVQRMMDGFFKPTRPKKKKK